MTRQSSLPNLEDDNSEINAEAVREFVTFPKTKTGTATIYKYVTETKKGNNQVDIERTLNGSETYSPTKSELEEQLYNEYGKFMTKFEVKRQKLKNSIIMTEFRDYLNQELNYSNEVIEKADVDYSVLCCMYLAREPMSDYSFDTFCTLNRVGSLNYSQRFTFDTYVDLNQIQSRAIEFMKANNEDSSNKMIKIDAYDSGSKKTLKIQEETRPKYVSQFKFRSEERSRSEAPNKPNIDNIVVRELKTNYLEFEPINSSKTRLKIAKNYRDSGWKTLLKRLIRNILEIEDDQNPFQDDRRISSDASREITKTISNFDPEEESESEIVDDVKNIISSKSDNIKHDANSRLDNMQLVGISISGGNGNELASLEVRSDGTLRSLIDEGTLDMEKVLEDVKPRNIRIIARIPAGEDPDKHGWDDFYINKNSWETTLRGIDETNKNLLNELFYNNDS